VRESLVLLKNTASFLPLSPTTDRCGVTGNGASNLRAQMGRLDARAGSSRW
jgi:hypothetical protein